MGQQTGRESENAVVDDYVGGRHAFELALANELRDATGVVRCPNLVTFAHEARSHVEQWRAIETQRGLSFTWSSLSTNDATASTLRLDVTVRLADALTSITDTVGFLISCTGAITRTGCANPSPQVCTTLTPA